MYFYIVLHPLYIQNILPNNPLVGIALFDIQDRLIFAFPLFLCQFVQMESLLCVQNGLIEAFERNRFQQVIHHLKTVAVYLPLLEIIRPLMSLYVHIYRGFRGKKDYTFTIPGK